MKYLVLALTLLTSPALATTWYVNSATGSDSYNGTSRTFVSGTTGPFATLQKAANSTAAGDTVDVAPGSGYGGGTGGTAPLVISTSGTGAGTTANTPCTSQIVYQSDPYYGAQAVITGTQAQAAVYGTDPLSCITINNFNVAGWNSSLTWAGASANAGLSGTGWQALAYNGNGIQFAGRTGGTGSTSVHHIMITNNTVHDFPANGISINYGDYATVTGNTVYNNGLYSPYADSGISLYEFHNIDSGTQTKNYVANNVSYANIEYIPNHGSNLGTTTGSGTNASGSTTINVASSSAANYTASVIDVTNGCIPPGDAIYYFGTGYIAIPTGTTCVINGSTTLLFSYVTDGEGIIIDNFSNSQSDSVAYVGRTLVTNNLVFNNGNSGLEAAPASVGVDITFNTAYQNQSYFNNEAAYGASNGEINLKTSTGLNIYNNVLYCSAASATTPYCGWDQSSGTTTWSNNSFYGGNSTPKTIPGSNNVTTLPALVNATTNPTTANFSLTNGSPLIGAGSATYTRTTDYAGHTGKPGANYEIGAYAVAHARGAMTSMGMGQ